MEEDTTKYFPLKEKIGLTSLIDSKTWMGDTTRPFSPKAGNRRLLRYNVMWLKSREEVENLNRDLDKSSLIKGTCFKVKGI